MGLVRETIYFFYEQLMHVPLLTFFTKKTNKSQRGLPTPSGFPRKLSIAIPVCDNIYCLYENWRSGDLFLTEETTAIIIRDPLTQVFCRRV